MNHPQQVHPQAPYGKPADPSMPVGEPERQCCGYTLAVLGSINTSISAIFFLIMSFFSGALAVRLAEFFDQPVPTGGIYFSLASGSAGLGCAALAYFLIRALASPEYLGGKPEFSKFVPYVVGVTLVTVIAPIFLMLTGFFSYLVVIQGVVSAVVQCGIGYAMFMLDDASGNCCLCFKPWTYKQPIVVYQQGYPPQGYPPQGYPQQGYPPRV